MIHIYHSIRLFASVWLLLLPLSAKPQAASERQPFTCGYYGEDINPEITLSKPTAEAIDVVGGIMRVVGLKPNFEIRAANVPNAAAVIINGKRYILYNPKFISAINSASGTYWAGISIMAHEIGHHLNGHTLSNMGSRPDIELEADEFSGFILNKLGAELSDAQAALAIAASQKGSHTHPGRQDRLTAIATGWRNASGQPAGRDVPAYKKAVVKPVIVKNPETSPAIAEKYIAFDVKFNADPYGTYHITIRGNLVKVEGDSLYVIGRLGESNKKAFKLMLADKHYNYLYIASKGVLVNGVGEKVGQITERS